MTTKTLADLISEGWTPATEMPDNNRSVQIAYDDGSTSEHTIGFADEVSQIPPTGKRVWWVIGRCGGIYQNSNIIAWREREEVK